MWDGFSSRAVSKYTEIASIFCAIHCGIRESDAAAHVAHLIVQAVLPRLSSESFIRRLGAAGGWDVGEDVLRYRIKKHYA